MISNYYQTKYVYKKEKKRFCVTLVAATCLFLLSKSLSFNTNYTNFTKKMRLIKSISHRHRGRCTNFTNAFRFVVYAPAFSEISKCSRHSWCNLLSVRSLFSEIDYIERFEVREISEISIENEQVTILLQNKYCHS